MTTPNLATFINELFPQLPDDEIPCLTQGYLKTEGAAQMSFKNYPGTDKGLRRPPGKRAWYVCLSTVKLPEDDGYLNRKKESLRHAHVVMLDDVGTKSKTPDIEPSYIIETSPENFQWGYRLRPYDVSTPEGVRYFEACYRAFGTLGYADPEALGAYRVIRVPGSLHLKKNFVSTVTEWRPERIWSLDELMKAFGLEPVYKDAQTTQTNGLEYLPITPLDAADWTDSILSGKGLHGPINSLACHFAKEGLSQTAALSHIRALMEHSARRQTDPDTWQERYDDIERSVRTGYALLDPGIAKTTPDAEVHQYSAKKSLLKPFKKPPPPPEYIIDDLLPVAAGGLVGAGGTKKSTFMLWLSLRIIAGLPVFGRKINRPGPVLFITAEDERSLIEFRVYHMQQAMLEGMSLEEVGRVQQAWAEGMHVEDVSGELNARLVDADKWHMHEAVSVAKIIKEYKACKLSCLVIDPTIYFGPGESHINDGMAALMAVGKKFSKTLNCPVVFVHHVSQDVSRNEIIDVHSGRSGTAFGDNARFMYVIVNHRTSKDPKKKPKYFVPEDMKEQGCEQPIRLHQVKNSFGRMLSAPLWFDRKPAEPWSMVDIAGEMKTKEVAQEEHNAKFTRALIEDFLPFFKREFPDGGSKAAIEGANRSLMIDLKTASRDDTRELVRMAERDGLLARDLETQYKPLVLTDKGKKLLADAEKLSAKKQKAVIEKHKLPAKKTTAKKAPTKKAPTKKAPAKKAPARKTTAKNPRGPREVAEK